MFFVILYSRRELTFFKILFLFLVHCTFLCIICVEEAQAVLFLTSVLLQNLSGASRLSRLTTRTVLFQATLFNFI